MNITEEQVREMQDENTINEWMSEYIFGYPVVKARLTDKSPPFYLNGYVYSNAVRARPLNPVGNVADTMEAWDKYDGWSKLLCKPADRDEWSASMLSEKIYVQFEDKNKCMAICKCILLAQMADLNAEISAQEFPFK